MGTTTTTFPEPCREPAADGDRFALEGPVTFPLLPETVGMNARSTTFHELYIKYADDVYRFAHWLTGNPDDARDITSETFVRAFTGATEPRLESVKAYLFTIARNLHRKQWRRTSRHEPLDETMPDPTIRPDEAAANRDEFRRTMSALQTLPEIDRTVLLLRAADGLSYDDISAVTGLSRLRQCFDLILSETWYLLKILRVRFSESPNVVPRNYAISSLSHQFSR